MADDIAARLSAALHAYADLVEDGDPSDLPAVPAPVPPARRWLVPALVAAAAILIVGGAGWSLVGTGSDGPVAASAPERSAAAEEPGQASADGSADTDADTDEGAAEAPPGALTLPAPVDLGVPHPFDLYTHCGVLGADIDGLWFAADPPLAEEHRPPAGWDDPYQRGTLTLLAPGEAVFRDDVGHELRLVAAPGSTRPPACA
ncbi:MAG: hypothetical protein JWP33_4 [Blastococcus sp.]|nr:hypothetical protein [Blastococcus sp.]